MEQEVDKILQKVMQNQLKFWEKKEQRKTPEERVLITMEEDMWCRKCQASKERAAGLTSCTLIRKENGLASTQTVL